MALKVRDIDGERGLLRIEQGKGAKDRLVILAPDLLAKMRRYWSAYRPRHWLFPHAHRPDTHLSISTAQRVFTRVKRHCGVQKIVGIHGLRHAYATHQLEHVLPKGLMRIRHFGFLANRCRQDKLVRIRRALAAPLAATLTATAPTPGYPCPLCRRGTLQVIAQLLPQRPAWVAPG